MKEQETALQKVERAIEINGVILNIRSVFYGQIPLKKALESIVRRKTAQLDLI